MGKTDSKSFQIYLDNIGNKSLLSDEREKQLAKRIKDGDEKAIDQLVSANLRYVVTLANQYARQGVSVDDLVSEGNIGLLKAARKYGNASDKRFVSFAAPYIRDYMERAIERQTGLLRTPMTEAAKIEHLRSKMMSMSEPIPAGSQNNFSLLNVLEDTNASSADENVERETLSDELKGVMSVLNERENQVLVDYYGLQGERLTMAEIGEKMQLKRERVRQVRDTALRKLHRAARQGRT
jgi:RNA polymerase primary sigma factor